MAVNPSMFHKYNVIDTCSIWNILSSAQFYNATQEAKCEFICTVFVYYECLIKPRKEESYTDLKLQKTLQKEIDKGKFPTHHISIEDLQEIEVLENRMRLSKGELSSIVFAKKIRQAFLTDDQGARELAEMMLEKKMVQTTPQLFGWLFYSDYLRDGDKNRIIMEHKESQRPLSPYFDVMYLKALEMKLANLDC